MRLADRAAGEAVALRVAIGLVSRPAVFRYWGLPYSGRIATLAEDAIAEVRAGTLASHSSWPSFRAALARVSPEHQSTLVLTCVDGRGDVELAALWGCGVDAANRRRTRTLAHMKELAGRHGDRAGAARDERRGVRRAR